MNITVNCTAVYSVHISLYTYACSLVRRRCRSVRRTDSHNDRHTRCFLECIVHCHTEPSPGNIHTASPTCAVSSQTSVDMAYCFRTTSSNQACQFYANRPMRLPHISHIAPFCTFPQSVHIVFFA